MQNERESVFVSYSWDSQEHQEWVAYLVRRLRNEGYNATYDQYITSQNTINLNRMMVEHIKNDDFIIVVVTENYVKKSDEFAGGVGFETELLLSVINENRDKVIMVTKQPNINSKKAPFYLKGYHYIDFSNDEFESSLDALIHRLQRTPQYDIGEIGEKRIRQPKVPVIQSAGNVSTIKIPSLNKVSDLDKNRYMNQSFQELNKQLSGIFNNITKENPGFEFEENKVNEFKVVYEFYIHGKQVHKIKLWLDSFGGSSAKVIQYYLGNHLSISNDNSSNGYISLEISEGNQFTFSMPMNMMKPNKNMTLDEVIAEIYNSNVFPYLR
ncbi:toll/interleukin-1 receptor domain-containing protein [Solibacillus silvestris]|uniref:toll/interleukin-1 receptor domain-containing protein n=1 Tax=Solibacillus silvestris TaxID=76853 RepID=UPI003F7F4463